MRLAVFADIHGNLPALQAVLRDMRSCGPFDKIWCLGDLAALGGQPQECIEALMELRDQAGEDKFKIIGGNTDRYLATGARPPIAGPNDEAGFDAYRAQVRSSNAIYAWNLARLSWAGFTLLGDVLGRETKLRLADYGSVIGFHAIPGDDESVALRPDSPEEEAADALLDRQGRLALCGHTHLALDRRLGNWRVINPGSVGLSFGNPGLAEWAALQWRAGVLTLDLRRVPYDVAATLSAWDKLGYPEIDWIAARLTPGMD